MLDAELLLTGEVPLNMLSLGNLCSVIEASILSSKVFLTADVRFGNSQGPLVAQLCAGEILDPSPRYLNQAASQRSLTDYSPAYPKEHPMPARLRMRDGVMAALSNTELRYKLFTRDMAEWSDDFSDSLARALELADFGNWP